MDTHLFHILKTRYAQLGGLRLVWQYARMGLLWPAVRRVLRDMLYAYWREHDCVLSYYLFHTFFDMLRKVFPQEIAAMPFAYAPRRFALVKHRAEPISEEKWPRLTERVCFHKLTYMVDRKVAEKEGTYYRWVVSDFK